MKKWFVSLLLTALAIVLAACSNDGEGTASGSSSDPVKVNIATLSLPVALVANELGYFKEEFEKVNAEYEISLHTSGPPINEGIASKRVDLGILGEGAVVGGANNKLDTKIISVLSDGLKGINIIIATKESGIEKPEQLKGKKIAVAFGTSHHVFLLKILQEAGLTADDVNLVNLQIPDGHPAFQTNQVDAWVTADTYSKVEAPNGAVVIATPEASKLYSPMFYVARGEFAKQHPEIVEAYLKAIDRAVEFAKTDYDQFISVAAKAAGQDEQLVRLSDTNNAVNEAPSEELIQEFQKSTEILLELGYVEKEIDVEQLLDLSFINKIRGQ